MSLETLERGAPSMFKPGKAALSKMAAYCALALLLMVADARFKLTEPVRQGVATVLFPLQWAMMQPVRLLSGVVDYLQTVEEAQADANDTRRQMTTMALQASQVDMLARENEQLRQMMELRPRVDVPALAAEVVYETPDSYSRRVVIDKGQVAGVVEGSPVIDELGVLGQVTRVHPFTSEVTLLVDRDQAIPVLVPRTGARSVAYGDASNLRADGIELRFMPSDTDVQEGDILTTSGVDGVYPPNLPVARVVNVERRADSSAFIRIDCLPLARMQGARHVMVLKPLNAIMAETHPELLPENLNNDHVKPLVREDKSAQRRATPTHAPLHGVGTQATEPEAQP